MGSKQNKKIKKNKKIYTNGDIFITVIDWPIVEYCFFNSLLYLLSVHGSAVKTLGLPAGKLAAQVQDLSVIQRG